jgi:hypothetical protein
LKRRIAKRRSRSGFSSLIQRRSHSQKIQNELPKLQTELKRAKGRDVFTSGAKLNAWIAGTICTRSHGHTCFPRIHFRPTLFWLLLSQPLEAQKPIVQLFTRDMTGHWHLSIFESEIRREYLERGPTQTYDVEMRNRLMTDEPQVELVPLNLHLLRDQYVIE